MERDPRLKLSIELTQDEAQVLLVYLERLIAVVAYLADLFPDMTIAEMSVTMQEAMAEAEKKVLRPR